MSARSSAKTKQTRGVRLDPDLLDRIKELAKKEQRTVSNTVEVLLGEAVQKRISHEVAA